MDGRLPPARKDRGRQNPAYRPTRPPPVVLPAGMRLQPSAVRLRSSGFPPGFPPGRPRPGATPARAAVRTASRFGIARGENPSGVRVWTSSHMGNTPFPYGCCGGGP
ncbi:hypothetical protein HEK616_12000 [Streptomyces nigrescens]|uniref:Uncharacterized protein n=1 Tax=Streptomyces nigrescens TaxID=1920 RepID=A0ABN6QRX7_STRNI|nr:hypothetical protein HEK616_12000 [Streptomyces nigrescens]